MAFFLLLLLVAVVLAFIGLVVEALGYLLIAGIALLVLALVYYAVHWTRRTTR